MPAVSGLGWVTRGASALHVSCAEILDMAQERREQVARVEADTPAARDRMRAAVAALNAANGGAYERRAIRGRTHQLPRLWRRLHMDCFGAGILCGSWAAKAKAVQGVQAGAQDIIARPRRISLRVVRIGGEDTEMWLQSVRREAARRLRMRTMRWPLAGDRERVWENHGAVFDNRVRLTARDAEGTRPA
jgi:hypothetical protein